MGRVILLDEHTANQIAAGEVIERPASVIKELVENSLDAGARSVSIDIQKGGIASMRVTDDGEGFLWDDVPLAFERHATSKLRTADDLSRVMTLGFRGEALPSIAAVSKVRLTTRRREAELGRQIEYHGGRLVEDGEVGCPVGTTVSVSELFYNLPARYKFLKKDSAEAAQISELVGRLAVGRPDIAFTLTSRGAEILRTHGGGRPEDAIYAVLGRETLDGMLPLRGGDGHIKVGGFVGRPEIARGNRNCQLFYVNGRLVKNRVMYAALEEAYRTHMLKKRYPVAVLYLTVDLGLLDVNAHPAKTEVRFYNESELFGAIYHVAAAALGGEKTADRDRAYDRPSAVPDAAGDTGGAARRVSEQLGLYDARPEARGESADFVPVQTVNPTVGERVFDTAASGGFIGASAAAVARADVTSAVYSVPVAESEPEPEPTPVFILTSDNADIDSATHGIDTTMPHRGIIANANAREYTSVSAPAPTSAPNPETERTGGAAFGLFASARLIGQVFGTYIMLERDGDLVLVDQHAAHERVMFERIKAQMEMGVVPRQMLLEAQTVNLLPDEMLFAREASEYFAKAGFLVEEFGRDAIIIREVPLYLERRDTRGFFLELLEIVRRGIAKGERPDGRGAYDEEMLYDIACKAAVKGNRPLDAREAEALLSEVEALPGPLTCPHGRPLIVTIAKRELDKRFKRE